MEISEEKIKHIIYLYDIEKESINKISKENGIDQRTIKSILLKNNIPIRSNNFYKNKSVDSNFFEKIDTQEKAYILGFIYADGCLTNGALQIKVSIKDIEILCKIKYILKSDHKITKAINHNGYGVDNEYCSLRIKDLNIEKCLLNLGVKPRKTKCLKFPNGLLSDFLIRHFIRGFFDGDGSIYSSNSSCISFTGTEDMLLGIRNELQKITSTKANIYKYKNKDIYEYKIGGHNNINNIYDYLYKDSNIFLERKKNKFEEILKLF